MGRLGVREDVLREVAELLAGELEGTQEDLDSLETRVIQILRQVGQRTLQRKLADKKRGTQAAASSVPAAGRPGS